MSDEEFIQTSEEERWLTDINYPIGTCLERLNVEGAVRDLLKRVDMYKTEVKITPHFSLFIQNIVLTAQLKRKVTRQVPATLAIQGAFAQSASAIKSIVRTHMPAGSALDGLPIDSLLGMSEEDDHARLDNSIVWLEDLAPNVSTPAWEDKSDNYHIPIDALVYRLRHMGVQYNPRRFAAAICRNDNLRSAALIFASGNFVSTGCSRMELALWMFKDTLDKIADSDYCDFEEPYPQLRNIVSSGRLPNRICTFLLAALHSDCCRRADRFPGTMIQDPERLGKRVILVFDSGKVCHSGAHSIAEARGDMQEIYPMLVECQYTVENEAYDKQAEAILSDESPDPEKIHTFRTRIREDRDARRRKTREKRSDGATKRARTVKEKKPQSSTTLHLDLSDEDLY